jgi:hypothetical protein
VYIAHVILSVRNFVRAIDLEGTRLHYDPVGTWYFLMATKLTGSYANLIMMINNFELSRIRMLISVLIIFTGMSCIITGIYDLDYLLKNNVLGILLQYIPVYALGIFQSYVHKNITREICESMIGRIEEQCKFE